MLETPQIIQTTDQPTAIIHLIVSWEEIKTVMGPTLEELMAEITAQGQAPTGPWFTHHLRRPTDTFDFEVSVPVSSPITAAGRVKPCAWPAMKVVRTVYQGPYEGLGSAWGEFLEWIEAQDHETTDDLWERYLVGPESTPDSGAWRTELSRPLR